MKRSVQNLTSRNIIILWARFSTNLLLATLGSVRKGRVVPRLPSGSIRCMSRKGKARKFLNASVAVLRFADYSSCFISLTRVVDVAVFTPSEYLLLAVIPLPRIPYTNSRLK